MRNHDFDAFFGKKIILGGKIGGGAKGSGASRPGQKVGPPDGAFGSTVIS